MGVVRHQCGGGLGGAGHKDRKEKKFNFRAGGKALLEAARPRAGGKGSSIRSSP